MRLNQNRKQGRVGEMRKANADQTRAESRENRRPYRRWTIHDFGMCKARQHERRRRCRLTRHARTTVGLHLRHLQDRFGEGMRRFLRQVMTDTAFDFMMPVLAREPTGVSGG